MNHRSTWRYIPPIAASGYIQMAIDEWLLEQHCHGLHPPTLRFYTWSPAAISLGYHQHRYPEFWQHLTWAGQPIDLVRRPTGGRAVLHQGDLTYAVITSGIPGSRMQAYQTICQFLIQGWRSLGIALDYGQAGRGYIHNPNCFGTATGADLVTPTGAKFIGSAQLRRGNAILQQGSMQLYPDPVLFQQIFGTEMQPIVFDHLSHVSHENQIQFIIDALLTSAQQSFGVELETQPLSEAEWSALLQKSAAKQR